MSQFHQSSDSHQTEYFLDDPVIKRIGPISAADVKAKLKAGQISGETLVITLGMTEWKRLDDSFWDKDEIRVGELVKESDASMTQQKITSSTTPQSERGHSGTSDPAKISSNQLEVKSELVDSMHAEENKLYLFKIELGWWQKLLSEIQNQDLIEDLQDIAFLKEQEERITSLSRNLSAKGLMEGSARDFIADEYHSFDKAAEKVEKQVAGILQKLNEDEFITEFFNSTNAVGKDWFQSHLNQVQALCHKFTVANSHRIVGNDNLDVWRLFGEKYGEEEDLPLLRDLIMVGQKNNLDLSVLEAVNSPVLQKLHETIKAFDRLVDENGKVIKDIESNFKHYKDLQGLTSSRVLNQLLMDLDTKLKEAKIIETIPFEINPNQRDKITKEIKRLQGLKNYDWMQNDQVSFFDKANKVSFHTIFNNEIDKSLDAMNLSLRHVEGIIEQKNKEEREEKNQKLNILNQEITRLQTEINDMEKNKETGFKVFVIIFTVTWIAVSMWALNR